MMAIDVTGLPLVFSHFRNVEFDICVKVVKWQILVSGNTGKASLFTAATYLGVKQSAVLFVL